MKLIPHQVGDVVYLLHTLHVSGRHQYSHLAEVVVRKRKDSKNKHGTILPPKYEVEEKGINGHWFGIDHARLLTKEEAVAWKLRNGSEILGEVHG